MTEVSLKDVNFRELCQRKYFSSPAAWEDQVLYFLMLDRFSDGREDGYLSVDGKMVRGTTPLFCNEDNANAISNEQNAAAWRQAGTVWAGGTLRGVESKLGYLKRLGITALWISPVFRQVAFEESYHGYGIQNFLDIDPHFGTREDLKRLVESAHRQGIYVILDIVLNHTGNVFRYDPVTARHFSGAGESQSPDFRYDGQPYAGGGYTDENGNPTISFREVPDELDGATVPWDKAVWPREFQDPSFYMQKGYIRRWGRLPDYMEGDFYDFKKLRLLPDQNDYRDVDNFQPAAAMNALCEAYKFWIAYADIDGYRLDTIRHIPVGATRFFAQSVHEFAQSLGKENFYLIGEISGGREYACRVVEQSGLDAALGIDDIPGKVANLVKGTCNPEEYFGLFRNSLLVNKESHTWFNNKVVTMFEDHDEVSKGPYKSRFCAGDDGNPEHPNRELVLNAFAVNVTTLGIPCIYYGGEQGFDGQGDSDRYLREAMFGGAFGAFRSCQRHCFDENNPIYKELAAILKLRREKVIIRRGRQYLREISGNGADFGYPQVMGGRMRSVVPWSRIFAGEEMVLAINTDYDQEHTVWVTIDAELNREGDVFCCIYSRNGKQTGTETVAISRGNRRVAVLTVAARGFVIFEKKPAF
ncbi:MAG TPA: alpha-amylase family glycosyl hydrolase [Patescibacteria group bacterium]|nr:alpha-amylase family glycosyl hydrolase [Patescibacteria group bacterium]